MEVYSSAGPIGEIGPESGVEQILSRNVSGLGKGVISWWFLRKWSNMASIHILDW